MKLKDFEGLPKMMLSGVDYYSQEVEKYESMEQANTISFVLNDITYTAVEDPEDGYRSTMEKIFIDSVLVKNRFAPVAVMPVYYGQDDDSDIVKFVDVETGDVVLEVGTSYSDEWYPSFVAYFNPANMKLNEEQAKESEAQRLINLKLKQEELEALRVAQEAVNLIKQSEGFGEFS